VANGNGKLHAESDGITGPKLVKVPSASKVAVKEVDDKTVDAKKQKGAK